MSLNLIIDSNAKIPFYHQIYLSIAQKINENIIKDGEKLPNELDLCKDLGVSRITATQAYKELEIDGYVIRERGRGTFVRKKIESHALERLTSIVDDMKKKGVEIKVKIIEHAKTFASEKVRIITKLDPREKILYVKRVVYADNSPLYITKVHIPHSLTGEISKKILTDKSFMEIITKIYNLKIVHSRSILDPMIPDKETIQLLEMDNSKKNTILYMQTTWTVFSSGGAKLIYFEDYLNTSKSKFVLEKDYK